MFDAEPMNGKTFGKNPFKKELVVKDLSQSRNDTFAL